VSKLFRAIAFALLFLNMVPSRAFSQTDAGLNLIPWPKSVQPADGVLKLTPSSRIVVADEKLLPLAKVLASEIRLISGKRLAFTKGKSQAGDISIEFLPTLQSEAYELNITNAVKIQGRDYVACAHGTATLLQLMAIDKGMITVPHVAISDEPAIEFRSVMLDLARRWQPVETLQDTIELLRLYKIRYLHLHLSDNESFTFTSKTFPMLADPNRSYTTIQMNELVRYADERGVTIIPEIEMPGHCGPMVGRLPQLLGSVDSSGKAISTGVVNMANEKAYETLGTLIGELCDTFRSSPYIHIGADETSAAGLRKYPEYLPYVRKHGLKEAEDGNAGELFTHFIARIGQIIKSKGRTMIVWNGFPLEETPDVQMPKADMLVMAWTGSPQGLLDKGYNLINCCWLPLYMVPTQGRAPEPEWIYQWNDRQWGSWGESSPIEASADAPVLGAQICFWEQRYNEVMPILRPRVPALSERLWNPQAQKTFQDFSNRTTHTDQLLERIIRPVTIEAKGLLEPGGVTFDKQVQVTLKSTIPGKICCTVSKHWEQFTSVASPVYNGPITLNDSMTVSARLFDESGLPIGGVTQQRFSKITPAYKYRLMGPVPEVIWSQLPDFSTLVPLQTGVQGLMTADRGEQINRGMFAGIPIIGHIDVRPPGVWNPRALELTGQIKIPTTGSYVIKMKANDGQAELELAGHVICNARHSGADSLSQGAIPAGTYPFTIRYYNREITNDLNLQIRELSAAKFVPFEQLVVPINDWKPAAKLNTLSEGSQFVDPAKIGKMNLATDRPVTVSGGTQGDNVPANAVDGNTTNESGWFAGPAPQWLQVDMQHVYPINRIKVYTYYGDGRYYQYTIEASQDGKDWKQIVDMSSNTKPSTESGDEHLFPSIKARYVRITLLKNSANSGVHLNELMVFEAR
jgi:hexosaminidase